MNIHLPCPAARPFTLQIAIGFALCFSLLASVTGQDGATTTKPKLILDADTANEIDDFYAIICTLKQEKFDVLGLNSTQWFHYLGKRDSVQASQELNEDLIALLDRKDLPLPMGSSEPMGRPWGGEQPKDSAAAQFIIESAMGMPDGEKLNVLCIGAQTNLASAIKLKPEIAPKIRAYVLGFKYDAKASVWNKSEFNIRRDLNAADFVMNQKNLELHIMTASVSAALKFDRDDTFSRQAKMGPLGYYLTQRWKSRTPTVKQWTMWDLAIIQAMIHPEMATQKEVMTPPENTQRKVWVYDTIEAAAMRNDFWKDVK